MGTDASTADEVSKEWAIRLATPDDAEWIIPLEGSLFGRDAWAPQLVRDELSGPFRQYVVAEARADGSRLLGYAGVLVLGAEADIQTIAVAPEARRRGIGRALLGKLIHIAGCRGARELFLEVRADNPGAMALYREHGFTELGVRRGYYQPDNVDAVVMRARVPEPEAEPCLPPPPGAQRPADRNSEGAKN